jgi:hypothetical protein
LDLDKNGSVSREEFEKGPFIAKMPEKQRRGLFDRLDGNKNGEISPEEIRENLRKGPPRDPQRPPRDPQKPPRGSKGPKK